MNGHNYRIWVHGFNEKMFLVSILVSMEMRVKIESEIFTNFNPKKLLLNLNSYFSWVCLNPKKRNFLSFKYVKSFSVCVFAIN